MNKELIDVTNALIFALKIDGRKDKANTELIAEAERIVNIQPTFKKYGLLNGEPQTKSQIVDGRKGYLSRFVYCPYCGEKLNWKQVLSNCL